MFEEMCVVVGEKRDESDEKCIDATAHIDCWFAWQHGVGRVIQDMCSLAHFCTHTYRPH